MDEKGPDQRCKWSDARTREMQAQVAVLPQGREAAKKSEHRAKKRSDAELGGRMLLILMFDRLTPKSVFACACMAEQGPIMSDLISLLP